MKKGFTLAEVLITLGIIGVVAALTAPSLVQRTGSAKIGPTISKVVSTLENAHEQILNEQGANGLKAIASDNLEYFEVLSKHIKGSSYEDDVLTADSFNPALKNYDGSSMTLTYGKFNQFKFDDSVTLFLWKYGADISLYESKGSFTGAFGILYVDINGLTTKPNSRGKDVFVFYIDNSGSIIPAGSSTYAWLKNDDSYKYTAAEGDYACNKDLVTKGIGCAGSIFENNLKVIYE